MSSRMAAGERSGGVVRALRRKDGTTVSVEVGDAFRLADEERRPIGNVGIVTDVSERERARDAAEKAERRRDEVLAALAQHEERERTRIAGELHDDTVQVIAAALVTLDRSPAPTAAATMPRSKPTSSKRGRRFRWR